jgi:YHS domain-containing protein
MGRSNSGPAQSAQAAGLAMNRFSRRGFLHLIGPGALAALGAPALAAETARMALKGYDPVAYFTEKRATVGNPQFQMEWDGATYQFASASHLALFKGDPDRYLPQYSNLCAASVAKGVKIEGDPEHWLVVDGRLYLFGGPAGPGLMAADPGMTQRADENYKRVSQSLPPQRQ